MDREFFVKIGRLGGEAHKGTEAAKLRASKAGKASYLRRLFRALLEQENLLSEYPGALEAWLERTLGE
jgi:hypothetical protein